MDDPVTEMIAELSERLPDSGAACDEDELTTEQYDSDGATVRTVHGFIASYRELIRVIRENYLLPDPDRA